jgi:Protein of unknown function (DUF3307)
VTADQGLVLAWLILAHLVADFVLQPGRMARSKAGPGNAALPALLGHGLVVGLCVVPFGLAFGASGWWVLLIIMASHAVIDRVKAVLTRRAEAAALAEARRRHEAAGTAPDGLGPAWTPVPGALFAVDQFAHVAILVAAWAALLSVAPLDPGFAAWAGGWLGRWDQAVVHDVVFRGVVLASLLIVNIRAGALFVGVLVVPRLATGGRTAERPSSAPSPPVSAPAPSAVGWTFQVGPIEGRAVPDRAAPPSAEPAPAPPASAQSSAPPGRVGEAIGILERLLIATFVLVGAEAAIGLVIAAKTLARFKQLDDRDFAEYYLLGTLASVAVAAISAFVAVAALDSLG